MPTTKTIPLPAREDSVEAARAAIWRLFEEGRIDDDMATMTLLAIDLGTRRADRTDKRAISAGRPNYHKRRAA